jgi:hypothetical protein
MRNQPKGKPMKKTAIVLATTGALGLSAIAAPAPAEARMRGFGPALAGGLVAGAVVGGLASSAYAWEPGYTYYNGYAPAYYGYAPSYYGSYAYDAPYRWGSYTSTTYYDDYAPAYRYRRVVRPASAYYGGGPYARWNYGWGW